MNYINPIEILELQNLEISSIDNYAVKKAKSKLFAEIELSDAGYINYKGIELTKAACDKAIDDLQNRQFVEYYHYLSSNQLLNDFLVNGNENLFKKTWNFC